MVTAGKSMLNQKAPELVVEKWLSEKPDTVGKFVLIEWWGPSCAPCRLSIPKLNEYSKKFKKDLVIIALTGAKEEWVQRMKEPVIEYFSAIDRQGRTSKAVEVRFLPHAILIDPKGIIRWEGNPELPGYELTAEVIEKLIKKYK